MYTWVGKIPWRREWLPTPVFLPEKSHGQRSLVGCSPWGHKESDMTEQQSTHTHTQLLLLLSRFSPVRLCATPQTAAHQAPPSLGFSRQEPWSGLPFPSPMHESEKWKWNAQSCPTLSDPMDCSPPGSSAHGIFQARVLEWGAIAFSTHTQSTVKFLVIAQVIGWKTGT